MALRAARTLLRASAPRIATGAARGLAPAPLWRAQPAMAAVAGTRSYISVVKYTRDDVVEKLDAYRAEVFSTNWADYLNLVYNGPFWECEFEKLTGIVQPYLHEPEVGQKWAEVQELMDVLYQCEDVRDHLNELAELCTRASGFMGTGWAAEEKVDNMDAHAALCAEAYEAILVKHPKFKPKIEQTIGHGLAVLRQKHKFKWGTMHRYFF
eukprot:CAMPEP_0177178578 /NCGR_PEP_ID=MMETSP0367-20130122/14401_1 /TAXON_ID=447022 ORGANISM="Scrippsiella hangoei-like, Strain SHHI-4" /NCGR_SAMPLE_ID=MMETSP0367 /ASSEMBLY_ACC=CAM_ASM_000362 /LENGTH=209 /DNA_ID=CAMNT_0018625241 /DNA_START=84 /DNA_END=713 /DNA_ORIENTATION=-